MDHIKQRWAETEMAPPYGIGALHDLQHEAAHAASELDDAPEPLTRQEAGLVALVWIASVAAVLILGAHILARWGVL